MYRERSMIVQDPMDLLVTGAVLRTLAGKLAVQRLFIDGALILAGTT